MLIFQQQSFNPCYVGSKMESLVFVIIGLFLTFVSILVMLEVKWKDCAAFRSTGFILCFNPCYVGSKMESEKSIKLTPFVAMFQSLLCWK